MRAQQSLANSKEGTDEEMTAKEIVSLENVIVRYRTVDSFDMLFTGLEDCDHNSHRFVSNWIDDNVVQESSTMSGPVLSKPVLDLGRGYLEVGSRWPHEPKFRDRLTAVGYSNEMLVVLADVVKRHELGTILKQVGQTFERVSSDSYLADVVPENKIDTAKPPTYVKIATLLQKMCYGTILLIGCHEEAEKDPIIEYLKDMNVLGVEEYYDAFPERIFFESTSNTTLYSPYSQFEDIHGNEEDHDVAESPANPKNLKQVSGHIYQLVHGHIYALGESVLKLFETSVKDTLNSMIDRIVTSLESTIDPNVRGVKEAIQEYRNRTNAFTSSENDLIAFLKLLESKIPSPPNDLYIVLKRELEQFGGSFQKKLEDQTAFKTYFEFQNRRERLKSTIIKSKQVEVNSELIDVNEYIPIEADISSDYTVQGIVPRISGVVNEFRRTCSAKNATFVNVPRFVIEEARDDAVLDTVHDILFNLTLHHDIRAKRHMSTIQALRELSKCSPDMYLTLEHKVSKELMHHARKRFSKSVAYAVRFYTCNMHLLAKLFTDMIHRRNDTANNLPTVVLTLHEDAKVLKQVLTTVTMFRHHDIVDGENNDGTQLPTTDALKTWITSTSGTSPSVQPPGTSPFVQPPPQSSPRTVQPPPMQALDT
jgi:hypothetical protein